MNSEVESAMNHRRWRAALRDPGFTKEAFEAFSSADAYIRAARDGLRKAMEQYLTNVHVSFICPKKDNHVPVAPETKSSWHN